LENLFKILFVLFAALAALVFVLERFGKPMPEEQQASLSRWFVPLMAILAIAYVINYYFL
jgi:hypothetical protein